MKNNPIWLTIVVALILALLPVATPLRAAAAEGDNPYVSMVLNEQEAGALGLELLNVQERENGVSATYYYAKPSEGFGGGDFRMDLSVALGLHTLTEDISLEGKVSGCEKCRYPACREYTETTYHRPCYSQPAIEYTYVDAKGYTNFGVDVLDRNAVEINGETVFAQGDVRVTIQTSKLSYGAEAHFQECKSKHDEFVSAIAAKIGAGVQTKTEKPQQPEQEPKQEPKQEPEQQPEQEPSWDLNGPKGTIMAVIGKAEGGSFGEQRLTGQETEVWAPGDFELDDLEKIELILSDVKFQLDNPNLPQQKRNELAQHYHSLLQAKANVESHDLYASAWQDTAFAFADKAISYHPVIGGGYSVVKAGLQILITGKYGDAAMTLAGAIPWHNVGTGLSLTTDYYTTVDTALSSIASEQRVDTTDDRPAVWVPPSGYGGMVYPVEPVQ